MTAPKNSVTQVEVTAVKSNRRSGEATAPKSRITNAEATVVQKLRVAERQEGAVILPALNFLLTFCFKTKSKITRPLFEK